MERFPKRRSAAAPRAAYLLLALGLVIVSGCATGGKDKVAHIPDIPVLGKPTPPKPTGPVVERLADGREGFVIKESSNLDSESRADFERALALIKEENYSKSVELLEKVIAQAPGLTAPRINVAIAYSRMDKPEQAEQHLKSALELVPGHPVASNEYGLLLRKAGRFAEGRSVYEKALASFPEYHPIERNLAILCDLYLKDYACAREHYEIYSKALPKDKQVKLWLADMQTRTGHFAMNTGAAR